MKKVFSRVTAALICAFLAGFLALPAWALDLSTARGQGKVGERLNGFVAAIDTGPDVQALVAEVNARRKAEYARISEQNKQPLEVVGKLAAEKIIGQLPPGAAYEGAGGGWRKR